jgi:hypothetical protein
LSLGLLLLQRNWFESPGSILCFFVVERLRISLILRILTHTIFMVRSSLGNMISSALLLGALPLVMALPHGHEPVKNTNATSSGMSGMNMGPKDVEFSESFNVPNYFRHPEMTLWIYGHIAAMMFSWCILLPLSKLREK